MNNEKLELLNLAINFNPNHKTQKTPSEILSLMGEVVLEYKGISNEENVHEAEYLLLSGSIVNIKKTNNLAKDYLIATFHPAFRSLSKKHDKNIF